MFTDFSMVSKGHVVVFFYGVKAEPPLSALQILPFQDFRPPFAGQSISEKMVCFATVDNMEYSCLVLSINYVSSLEQLWNETFRTCKRLYEDMGKRWSTELRLISPTLSIQDAMSPHPSDFASLPMVEPEDVKYFISLDDLKHEAPMNSEQLSEQNQETDSREASLLADLTVRSRSDTPALRSGAGDKIPSTSATTDAIPRSYLVTQ
ncbi:hypothetical protein RvY_02073 [Ramazzottius varieornatus]|uniref:Uncharacterized protein n=1 Tax=Ramazzottius varieornatus TaxID=947166 RepID=A0A1D1ULV7_RAMVA|nr:hypothetical protein RvY_02073 [Ramazzottius varieornatus]